ncbi:hypothetical protein [Sutcliffiella halmapala]|uniref:hypothetical protein n=1 Tax=Sutcliffiella halmapala TaxID=79882 RepID=UPI000995C0A2|nr:hypothetical protein [Sutcliffiella halmapala]
MRASIMSYDTNIVKKGFYFEWELLSKFYKCKASEVEFLGHSSTGSTVYSTPKGNIVVISKTCDFNTETGRGSFKFRPYKGDVAKLKVKYVEAFREEKEKFLEILKLEGNQLKVPGIDSFKTLPEAIAGYTSVVSNSWGCNEDQHIQIMSLKQELHEWIAAEGYSS